MTQEPGPDRPLVVGCVARPQVAIVSRFVFWMIAPDAKRHAIGGIGEGQLAVRLAFARDLAGGGVHLHVDARFRRAGGLHTAPHFFQRQEFHRKFGLRDGDQGFATPITPQATRPPASPVGCVFKSSAFSCTMTL